MISVRINANGIDALVKKLLEFGKEGKKEIRRAVIAATMKAQEQAKKNVLHGEKTGIIYHRTPGGGVSSTHQASAPGESPATDTGDLARSIKADAPKGLIFSDLDYAFWLEFGTRDGKIKPRPFLTPAAESVKPFLVIKLKEGLKKAAERAGF